VKEKIFPTASVDETKSAVRFSFDFTFSHFCIAFENTPPCCHQSGSN